jgi:cell division protein FtsL
MKNLKPAVIAFIVVPMLLISCSGNSSKNSSEADKKLGKLKVEIPAELNDKPEVVNYINGMHEVADEYALIIDQVMDEAGHLAGVPEEDLTMMQKIKLVKLTAEVASKSTVTMAKWAEFQEQRVAIEEQMTDEELEALEAVWARFEERIKQIDNKYKGALLKENQE